jgi:hypothetical protein
MPDGIARTARAQNLGNINLRLCVRGEQDQRHARRTTAIALKIRFPNEKSGAP